MKIRKNKKIILLSSLVGMGLVATSVLSACNANKSKHNQNNLLTVTKIEDFVSLDDELMFKIKVDALIDNEIKVAIKSKTNNTVYYSKPLKINKTINEVYFSDLKNDEYIIDAFVVLNNNETNNQIKVNSNNVFKLNVLDINFVSTNQQFSYDANNYSLSFNTNKNTNESIKIVLNGQEDNKEYIAVANINNRSIIFSFDNLNLNQTYKIKNIDLLKPKTDLNLTNVKFNWNKDIVYSILKPNIKDNSLGINHIDLSFDDAKEIEFNNNNNLSLDFHLSNPIENKFFKWNLIEVDETTNEAINDSLTITTKSNSNDSSVIFSNLKENSKYKITNIQVYDDENYQTLNNEYNINLLNHSFRVASDNAINRTIELIYINNLNGQVDEVVWDNYKTKKQELKQPGIIRLLNDINKIKQERGADNVKVVLGGNNFAKNNDSSISKGEYASLVMQFLQPQASAINNDDLLWGYELVDENQVNFKTYIKSMFASNKNWLSSNLYINDNDNNNYKIGHDSKILDYNGFRIGLVGASSNHLKTNSNPNITKNIITKTNNETTTLITNEINNIKNSVDDIVLLTSLNADVTKNNELKTNPDNEFSEAYDVTKDINGVSTIFVNHYNKSFVTDFNDKWYANSKSDANGFVRLKIDLNQFNRMINKQIINVDHLSTSGDEKGNDFVDLNDLLNPQTNQYFNDNLVSLKNKIIEYKTNQLNEIKNQVIVANNPNRLRSANDSISSLGAYLVDLIANNYEFATTYNNDNFNFTKVDAVLINGSSIKSNLQPNSDVKVNNLLQILPYNNYFVVGDILVSDLKNEILKDTKGQIQFNDKIQVVYTLNEQNEKIISTIKIKNENNQFVDLENNQSIKVAILNFMYFSADYNFKTTIQNPVFYNKNNVRDLVWDLMLKNNIIDSKYNDATFKTNDHRLLNNQPISPENSEANQPTNHSLNNQELPNNKLRIGHWNVLHQSGEFDLKNEALAKVILANKYDVIGLTEIDPITANHTSDEQRNLAVSAIVSYLNELSNSNDYSYVISQNLEGVENQALATDQHTSTERIGVIYNNKKVKLKAFANNEIGHIYSNPLKVTKFTNEEVDFSRPPFSIKLESINEIKNDFTLVFAHFDSPGFSSKSPKKENSVTKKELIDAGLIQANDKTKRKVQGSREADNAEELINVINETISIDNNSDDDIFFMGDTNIYLYNEAWAFRTFVQAGFANMLGDDEASKSSLSGNVGNFANPYDKMYKRTNLITENPSIYNLWNIYEDNIINNDWETKARKLSPKNASKDKLEFIRSYISDHAPTYFDLTLNANDEK